MKIKNWLLVPVLTLAVGLTGCSRSVSGSYVQQAPRMAALLQLTETPDKRLIGTVQTIALQDNGSLYQNTSNLSGAVDGDTLTITVESGSFADAKRNLSGKVSGSTIDLVVPAGGSQPPFHALFEKSEISRFVTASSQLSDQSKASLAKQQAIREKAAAEQLALQQKAAAEQARLQRIAQMDDAVTKLVRDLNELSAKQTKLTEQVNVINKRYADSVRYAQKLLQREQQLVAMNTSQGKSNAKSVNHDLASLLHNVKNLDRDVRDSFTKWERIFSAVDSRILETQSYCQNPSGNAPPPVVAHAGQCQAMVDAIAAYRTVQPKLKATVKVAVDAMTQAFGELPSIQSEADLLLK